MSETVIMFSIFIAILVAGFLITRRDRHVKAEPEQEKRIEDDFCPDCAGKLTRENLLDYYMCICEGARDE